MLAAFTGPAGKESPVEQQFLTKRGTIISARIVDEDHGDHWYHPGEVTISVLKNELGDLARLPTAKEWAEKGQEVLQWIEKEMRTREANPNPPVASASVKVSEEMVSRFLSWPLPQSVRADACATDPTYPHRIGTNLLTADEARQMLEYVLQTEEDSDAS